VIEEQINGRIKKEALKYFKLFNSGDIINIGEMFSPDIILNDWTVKSEGKDDVLNAIQSIYDSVDSIYVLPQNIFCEKNTVVAELEVTINNSDVLMVVDILSFNDQRRIVEIRAYKR